MIGGEAWIVGALRTPVGRHGGVLSSVRPDDLAAGVIGELVARLELNANEIEDVVLGCANQAGEDNRNVARMAALLADLPESVSGVTVNRLCGSGLEAVATAAHAAAAGAGEIFIAGGVESMSRAPWAMPKPERSYPTGVETLYDTTLGWRFVNPKMEERGHTESLGQTAENLVAEPFAFDDGRAASAPSAPYDITREAQDRFALTSHHKAVRAIEAGAFDEEIAPVEVSRNRETQLVIRDESPRSDTSMERLAALAPAFRRGGTVTAGNSSPLNDGAAAIALCTPEYAVSRNLKPLARIRSAAVAGVPPRVMGIGPVPATQRALDRAGVSLDEIDVIELNEAFAAQSLAVLHHWGLDPDDERVNPNGGAIALGHPLGCSGARLVTTIVHEMDRRDQDCLGLVTMCIGVGQGIAMILESLSTRSRAGIR
jgi:3-oxoadipyl-CoA thiolase